VKITRSELKQLIKEEMSGQGFVYTVGKGQTKGDPWRDQPETEEELYQAIRKASRILEDLPLGELPDSVTKAAQNLRDALDVLPMPKSDSSSDPARADIYSYLNEQLPDHDKA
jgi:hypothetical protein